MTFIGHLSSFVYGQVCDWLPTFDEKNDQFVEMSRSKERIIKELNRHMKNLVEKMDEDTNKLLAEINAVYDKFDAKFDAKFDQIEKQNNQNKDVILAQDNANTEKILAKLTSLELKLEPKTCKQTNPHSICSSIQISDTNFHYHFLASVPKVMRFQISVKARTRLGI